MGAQISQISDFITSFFTPSKEPKVSSIVMRSMRAGSIATFLGFAMLMFRMSTSPKIACITGFAKEKNKALQSWCYFKSTYSIYNSSAESMAPHLGVVPDGADGEKTIHAYYQWVPWFLLLMAFLYLFPEWIWNNADKGYFKKVVNDLDGKILHPDDVGARNKDFGEVSQESKMVRASAVYFQHSLGAHRVYALRFLVIEAFAFVCSLLTILCTDKFLNGAFTQHSGTAVGYLFHHQHENNPLNYVFPNITKCSWFMYGPSGTIRKSDSLCLMPLNVLNEKIFTVLWVVYVSVVIISAIGILMHFIFAIFPIIRNSYLKLRFKNDEETKHNLKLVLPKCGYGNWFLMYQISKNIECFPTWIAVVKDELNK